ncbi:S8 family serine peptidase [Streptosporangium sp. NPDC023963]|uniref:S8 family serine peptidase n=1 Tax=Streptosporangium sp. NPDC023963 TaxID=3155608 RepID=UPI003442FC55
MPSGGSRLLAVAVALAVLAVTPPTYATTTLGTIRLDPVPAAGTPAHGAAAVTRTITLITGDKVTVRSGGTGTGTTVVRGPDGEPVGARVTTVGTDTYVHPDSAMPYLSAGLLDRRLFNVTRLLADDYDDAHVDHLPLIVTYADDSAARAAKALPEGATKVRTLSSIKGAAVTEDRDKAASFWSALTGGRAAAPGAREGGRGNAAPAFTSGIAKVWLDGKVKVDLADTVAQIGAPEVWAAGNTGEGVDVAVLDTGVDAGHPDLAGQIEASASFVPGEEVTDRHGHGTHVASTIAGTGAASGGKEKGVAPGAELHVGKVLSDQGQGQDSWIVAGMEWAAREQRAKVVSMSLGTDAPTDGTDPMSQAVNALSAETGALFTIAAGNAGPSERTVGAPGAADAALTVAAVDASDHLADFSSRGPRLVDGALKPELSAPGVGVLAARSQYAREGEGPYTTMSGTSMATPHVAGAAALLAAAHPGWTGGQLKDALMSTSKATPDHTAYQAGTGRLDARAATTATLFATGGAYLGIHPLEEEQGGEAERQVTYTNTSATEVTLDLALKVAGAPDGLFSLSASRVVVPAGGSGTVTLTADLDRVSEKNGYTGWIEASAGGGPVLARTVVGVSTEDRPRHLVIKARDRDGAPMSGQINLLREGDPADGYYSFLTFTGEVDVLVPQGRYSVWMWGDVRGTHGPSSLGLALLNEPLVTVEDDTTVTLDGTTVREAKAVTPQESADAETRVDYHRTLGDTASVADSYTLGTGYDSVWIQPTKRVREGRLSIGTRWRKIQPLLTVSSGGQAYDDLWIQPGAGLLPEGSQDLPAVFAGGGRAADYAGLDVKGKIAVVRYGDTDEQVPAAVAAGAKLLLIVNDEAGRLREAIRRTPLTVASLTMDEGEQLISRLGKESVRLRTVSRPDTAYLYDLVRRWEQSVPGDLTYRPAHRDLARVDVDFRNDPADEVAEYRFDVVPGLNTKVGYTLLSRSKRERTDWVTPGDSVRWTSEAEIPRKTWQFSGERSYRAGSTTGEQWFGPIQRPRVNDSIALPVREGNTLHVQVPGWGDSGADHVGLFGPGQLDQTTSLHQGGTLVAETGGYVLDAEVGQAGLPYRLVTTTERDAAAYPYSTTTRTVWNFTSAPSGSAEPVALPLVQLDYAVDTGVDGRASRSAALTILPSHLPGGPKAAIRSGELQVSYDDGATWRTERLTRTGDGWRARLDAPARARYVSLRAGARDERGNAVEQTIVRAFGLR